jgi:arsenate reductase (glutaredoxin)
MKLYAYKSCGSCVKAKKYLKEHSINFEEIPIRETPPSKKEISFMIDQYDGNWKPLFNTSGKDYRELKIKDKVLNRDGVIDLLHSNGNLIKRPFLVSEKASLVGFKEELWNTTFYK